MELYRKTSFKTSSLITRNYSSSFYLSTLLLKKSDREAIHSIYGFVRFADEIVDTFHIYDKNVLLNKFEMEMKDAIQQNISLNPVLNSFQETVHTYEIPYEYIDAFMRSMEQDLNKKTYTTNSETTQYIYGSANVIGLMCLKIFCNKDEELFNRLAPSASMLGSAFQKVNFLRDLKADTEVLERSYFSVMYGVKFSEDIKKQIIAEIETEFSIAFEGLKQLPGRSKLAVLTAFRYYKSLLRKIKRTDATVILQKRIRISNTKKLGLMAKAAIEWKLNLV